MKCGKNLDLLLSLPFFVEGCLFLFFHPPPETIDLWERPQPALLINWLFFYTSIRNTIQSAFKNLWLALHPLVRPVLGDVCSSLLFFPWDVCLWACRWPGSCSSVASYTSRFLVVWFLILFSFSLFMLLKTYFGLLEVVKMLCYHFSRTHLFWQRSWLFESNNKKGKMGYERS